MRLISIGMRVKNSRPKQRTRVLKRNYQASVFIGKSLGILLTKFRPFLRNNWKKFTSLNLMIFMGCCTNLVAEPICPLRTGNAALIIIDMQPIFLDRMPKTMLEQLFESQNQVIERAKAARLPIIFVEYGYEILRRKGALGYLKYRSRQPNNWIEYFFGVTDPNKIFLNLVLKSFETVDFLKSAVTNYKEIKFFKKTTDGIFNSGNENLDEIEHYLKQKSISRLIFLGVQGDGCVLQSIQGALDGNCDVVAYEKGIANGYRYSNGQYFGFQHLADLHLNCRNCFFNKVSNIHDLSKYITN